MCSFVPNLFYTSFCHRVPNPNHSIFFYKFNNCKAPTEADNDAPPVDPDNYVLLDFRMLTWKYLNFSMKFRDDTHIFTIKKLLAERHGRVADMQICFNAFSEANTIRDEMLTLKDCGLTGRQPEMMKNSNGHWVIDEASIPVTQVFYDYKPLDYSDPIMLFHK